jgi:hypothetical protein
MRVSLNRELIESAITTKYPDATNFEWVGGFVHFDSESGEQQVQQDQRQFIDTIQQLVQKNIAMEGATNAFGNLIRSLIKDNIVVNLSGV